MTHFRKERVESMLAKEISDILLRKIQDPRIRNIHVVSVKISPDLGAARVNYSTLEANQDVEAIQKGLDRAKPFFRSEIRKVIQMRKIPEIFFVFDPSIREGDRILSVLRKIEPAKTGGEPSPAAPSESDEDFDAEEDFPPKDGE